MGISVHWTMGELNEAEAANIIRGQRWALKSRKTSVPGLLSHDYLRELHARMYGDVWKWAGKYRQHDTSIGVPYPKIWPELKVLFDDALHWIAHATYDPEDIAIRLHHRLVLVHPFPNRNGRISRLLADLLLMKHFGKPRLPWGGAALIGGTSRRAEYIAALGDADRHDYDAILKFSRSHGAS